jgi:hypothetical protein
MPNVRWRCWAGRCQRPGCGRWVIWPGRRCGAVPAGYGRGRSWQAPPSVATLRWRQPEPTNDSRFSTTTRAPECSWRGRACAALRQYARAFPIARPGAWLYQGLRAHRSGHHRRALAAWRKSLITAERLAMPCEQGRAHYQIGRHLPAGHPAQQAHLTRAGQIFTDIGALYELGQVQAAMSRS